MPAVRPALRHQNAGSRMGGPLAQLELHQIGIERCECTIEGAAQVRYHDVRYFGDTRAGVGIDKPGGKVCGEAIGVVDQFSPMRTVESCINLAEIPYMRTMQDRGAQFCRLDGVLAAVLDQ